MADYNTEQFEKDCKALGVTLSDEHDPTVFEIL